MYAFITYHVIDFMTRNPRVIKAESTVLEAEKIFHNHDFNGLPVVDDQNRLIGMVTKLDILKVFIFNETLKIPRYTVLMNRKIRKIISTSPDIMSAETPLTRVLQKAVETGKKSFPVTDDAGRVIGIIAREDILRALHTAAAEEDPGWNENAKEEENEKIR